MKAARSFYALESEELQQRSLDSTCRKSLPISAPTPPLNQLHHPQIPPTILNY